MPNDRDMALQNKREFSRVEAHIPVEIRFVPPEERRHIHSRVDDEIPVLDLPPDVADPLLAEWLKLLNKKIDMLLRTSVVKEEHASRIACKAETISGGGLSFIASQDFSRDDVLEARIKLSGKLSQTLYVYGEVIQSMKTTDGYLTSLRFILLNDAIRDAIIKFVFEREREILRERRG